MKTFKCDRCSKLYIPEQKYPYYTVSKRIHGGSGFQYVDLCPECYRGLCQFLSIEIEDDETGYLE